MIILCPHAAVVESAYTADLKSAPKGYGFKSRQRHHVRRTQLRSVSAVCVRAAKTAHPLSPSSFQTRSSRSFEFVIVVPPPNIVKTLFAVSISAPPFLLSKAKPARLRFCFTGGDVGADIIRPRKTGYITRKSPANVVGTQTCCRGDLWSPAQDKIGLPPFSGELCMISMSARRATKGRPYRSLAVRRY